MQLEIFLKEFVQYVPPLSPLAIALLLSFLFFIIFIFFSNLILCFGFELCFLLLKNTNRNLEIFSDSLGVVTCCVFISLIMYRYFLYADFS